jgi:hypothetical protein
MCGDFGQMRVGEGRGEFRGVAVQVFEAQGENTPVQRAFYAPESFFADSSAATKPAPKSSGKRDW